jgi:predicted RNA-binding Zn-ribbon protein involved in translation (DUF1610 family)
MSDDDDLADLDSPNCLNNLVRMEPEEHGREVVWVCPECGLVKLSV